jgi:cell division protein FtsL
MNINQLLNDIQSRLNSFLNKSSGAQSSQIKDQLDVLLRQIDKKLAGLILFSVVAVLLGFGNLMRQWSLQSELSDLNEKIASIQTFNEETGQKLSKLSGNNRSTIEQAKLAPKSSSELLKLISEAIQRSGMALTKVASAGAQSPDMFTFEAEGGYGGVRMVLSELRMYSASMDVRSMSVVMEPTRKTLVLSTSFRFVVPPKMAHNSTNEYDAHVYMDGSPQLISKNRYHHKAQFSPKADASGQQAIQPQESAQSSKTPLAVEPAGPDRDPFYSAPGASSSGAYPRPSGGSGVSSISRSVPVRTNDGIYLTGCLLSNKKSACIFQLADGTSSVVKPGGQVSKNITLVKVFDNSVTIRSSGKEIKIKVGEQIK